MGSQLWMHYDVRNWLTDLRDSDPRLARLVGEAVLALLDAGETLGPPLVVSLPPVLREVASPRPDRSRQRLQEGRIRARREVAEAQTTRRRFELMAYQLDRQAARLASQTDEAVKAGREDLASETRTHEASIREQLARLRHRLRVLVAEEERLTAVIQGQQAEDMQPAEREKAVKAIVLRPGAPDNVRVSLLFVLQAPDSAVLLAHVTDPGASPDECRAVIDARMRAVGLPPGQPGLAAETSVTAPFTFYDATSLLDEFFAGEETELGIGAGALLARHRAHTLGEARQRMELTQAQVARRMNVRQERVSAIERAEPGAVQVRTLAAYVAALGGRLEVIAHIDDESITLSNHPQP